LGGNGGNDFSVATGDAAFISGGDFRFIAFNGGAGRNGQTGYSFLANGGDITLYGVFSLTQGGALLTAPTTFTSGTGAFFGTLLNSETVDPFFGTVNGPVQQYTYSVKNGGSLTLVPAAVPEASTTVSLGLFLALGGLVLAAKRRKAPPSL